MFPQLTAFSLLATLSLFSSSIALPLDIPHLLPRSYSIVNVDGSSSPTTYAPASAVTQTVIDTVTAPGKTSIATVNGDSATETVYVTVTPTPNPSATLPPVIPYFPPHLNSTSSSIASTSVKAAISLSTSTTSKPCEETPAVFGDGAPWRQSYTLVPTSTTPSYPVAYATGSYDAPIAARPSGMTGPLPILPPAALHWLNITEIPNAKRRVLVN